MLTLLSRMMLLLDTTKHNVCDMITVSIIAHVYMYDLVFTFISINFNNGFRNHAPGPHGLAIKHHPLGDDAYYILGHKLIAVIIHNSCFICFTVRPGSKQAWSVPDVTIYHAQF